MVLCNYLDSNYILKQANKIREKKSYIPNETLVDFIHEWLQFHQKKEMLTKAGKDLSPEDEKLKKKLDRMKVYVLDAIIFPAMADLIYFFDALTVSEKLSGAFDGDVAELLDPRKAARAAKSGVDTRFSCIQFRNNNLARLITGVLSIHTKRDKDGNIIPDFRIGLMYQILNIVGDMMDRLIADQFSFGNQIWKSAFEDYQRMMGWMGLLAGSAGEKSQEYDRNIGFSPIWYSNKADLASFSL